MNSAPNPQLDLAFQFIHQTNKHIFLTGKAGTGKTTFLRQVRKESIKRMAVVAPTGVAAINAEGVTIHSFFQLPFGTFLPGQIREEMKKRKFARKKIKLLKSLDLLIIDEISMVRADVLDAIDEVLRRYRDYTKPFGGVQLLMIGDLHQLPPVVKPEDWQILKPHYDTVYFFGSLALKKTEVIRIELQHIYRQSDAVFIELLNKIRGNRMDEEVLKTLNSRYQPDFRPGKDDDYITLTSHNRTSQQINAEKLKEIAGPSFKYKATVSGDFPPHTYPTEEVLEFKLGAQVMFVKNDLSGAAAFYNGKIGRITKILGEKVWVQCPGDSDPIEVLATDWHNRKFTLNEETKEVQEELIGTFHQLPLKLAWAITIHKSQGLTFERVIIDAQAAFAHGQVYVALSRCKSFEGIVLRTEIKSSSVKTDTVVRNYSQQTKDNNPDEAQLAQAKRAFQQEILRDLFSFKVLRTRIDQLRRIVLENDQAMQGNIYEASAILKSKARDQVISFAEKFAPQLEGYLQQAQLPEKNEALLERLSKASSYFLKQIKEEIIPAVENIEILSDNKAIAKKALQSIEDLRKELAIKQASFTAVEKQFIPHNYIKAKVNAELDFEKTPVKKSSPRKSPKDASHPLLYELLNQWRADTSSEQEVERYSVMATRSLLEIVEVLPTSMASLKRVKGIGKVRAEKYGPAILEIVNQYCQEHELPTDQLQFSTGKPPKPPKPDTKMLTFELYQTGKSIEDVAKARGLASSTIASHLSHFVGTGELDVFSFVDKAKVTKIEAYFAKADNTSFTEAKLALGDDISYGDIRMVLSYVKSKEEPSDADSKQQEDDVEE